MATHAPATSSGMTQNFSPSHTDGTYIRAVPGK